MIRLKQSEACELLSRLKQYPPDAWEYEPTRQSISMATKSGSSVEILFKSWPGWGDHDYGHVYEQYHLMVGGVAIGAIDGGGREVDIWKVIDLKDLYHRIINDQAIQSKLDKVRQRRDDLAREAEVRREQEYRALLEQI